MEIDAVRAIYNRLTQEQKEYRRQNGLCMYCGEKHNWRECPKRSKTGNFKKQGRSKSKYKQGRQDGSASYSFSN